jgi:hydroxymethylbilane synthase
VDTRLRRLEAGEWDGIFVAAAGLRRLGVQPRHAVPLAPDAFVPAVGQGILGVEVRRADARTGALVAALDHAATRACALAERAYLGRLGASCNTPLAAHATLAPGVLGPRLAMTAVVASEDGRRVLRADAAGAPGDAEAVGRALAETLLAQGAESVARLDPGRGRA